jgi:hypothetical protein
MWSAVGSFLMILIYMFAPQQQKAAGAWCRQPAHPSSDRSAARHWAHSRRQFLAAADRLSAGDHPLHQVPADGPVHDRPVSDRHARHRPKVLRQRRVWHSRGVSGDNRFLSEHMSLPAAIGVFSASPSG